jgi:hypothetical protein
VPATILIVTSDRNSEIEAYRRGQIVEVRDAPYTAGGGADITKFYQFVISDKTPASVDEKFFQTWDKDISMNTIAGPDPSGFRRIRVRNNNINVSESIGDFTVQGTDYINAEWNQRYPTANLVTVGFPAYGQWDCEGTFVSGQALEFEEVIKSQGVDEIDFRRIWYITEAGMLNIDAAGGLQTGTANQLSQIVRDGRLD